MSEQQVLTSQSSSARLWRALFLLACAFSFYAALRPQAGVPHWFAHSDKLLHAGTFAVLTLLALRTGWLKAWQAFALLSAFGLGIEFAQSMTTYRTADVLDWLADMLGSGLALVPWWAYQRCRG